MAHSLLRLRQELYNTPHLITAAGLNPIVDYLQARNEINFLLPAQSQTSKPAVRNSGSKVGEILIDGAITTRPVQMACAPESTNYRSIVSQASALIDSGIETLVTVHSSHGGQACQMFSTANAVREMCDEAGVKWIAYADTISASASYGLQCAADEVIMHPEASVGSIGALICLMDDSKALEMAGIKPVYLSSLEGKVPFDAEGRFTEDFLQRMKADVVELGNKFAAHVSDYTGISTDEILSLNAQMFNAEKAMEIGLVNKVMTHKQFLSYLESI